MERRTSANNGLPRFGINALAIDPVTPTTLYVGRSSFDGAGGIYKSTNAGGNWTVMSNGLPTFAYVAAVVIDPLVTKRREKTVRELFYTHSLEGSRILLVNSDLRSKAAVMLARFLPTFQSVIERRPATVTTTDLRDIDALILAFMEKGSLSLRADLEKVRQELRSGTLLTTFGIRVVLN